MLQNAGVYSAVGLELVIGVQLAPNRTFWVCLCYTLSTSVLLNVSFLPHGVQSSLCVADIVVYAAD